MSISDDPSSESSLPPELFTSLKREEDAISLVLSQPGAQVPSSDARKLADKLLLSSTPLAIRKLRQIVQSGADKDALAAAGKILDKSPATRDLTNPLSSLSLNAETLGILARALGQFANLRDVTVATSEVIESSKEQEQL